MDLDTLLDMEEQEHSTGMDYVELISIWVDSFIQNLAYEFQKQNHLSDHPFPLFHSVFPSP